ERLQVGPAQEPVPLDRRARAADPADGHQDLLDADVEGIPGPADRAPGERDRIDPRAVDPARAPDRQADQPGLARLERLRAGPGDPDGFRTGRGGGPAVPSRGER